MRTLRTQLVAGLFAAGSTAGFVAGCGGDDSTIAVVERPAFKSGSRLRADMLGSDDANLFLGWHDAKLDADCSFLKAEDGALRCLPLGVNGVLFVDPDCTTPVWGNYDHLAVLPKRVLGSSSPRIACDEATEAYPVYEVGDAIQVEKRYGFSVDGACEVYSESGDESVMEFALKKVLPGEFVSAKLSQEPLDDELALSWLSADDGAEQLLGAVAVKLGSVCGGATMADGTMRCAPYETTSNSIAYVTYAEDASCTERLAYRITQKLDCPPPAFALAYPSETSCNDSWLYFEVGREAKPTMVYHGAQPGKADCMADDSLPTDHQFYRVGAEIALTSFPFLVRAPIGGGRIAIDYFQTSGGSLVTPAGFYDTVRREPCAQTEFCDGSKRCAPTAANIDGFYSDAECTRDLAAASIDERCDERLPTVAQRQTGECSDYLATGAEFTGTVYSRAEADQCVAVAASDAKVRYFEVGEKVDASAFEVLVERTE